MVATNGVLNSTINIFTLKKRLYVLYINRKKYSELEYKNVREHILDIIYDIKVLRKKEFKLFLKRLLK